ncbi:hypothetical protein HF329_10925 [Chitinophaga oryzae]|uniref:Oxygen sensor histidine kinase NreB n=1 Tax=Chitinophaga oryzae TaxID=2725414 RepID=A0AAE6ZFS7_9BACT|nr:ATP-binding protein [Chitinophaga oryzae]QJB31806.1 hypothetical protein HF329_10925 [Chitinophaga oryzae]
MQISSKEVYVLIGLITIIFLIAPLFLIIYINLYNNRKKRHAAEMASLKEAFGHELLKTQLEVQEQTLKTIAYDLHDNIGQLMSLTILTLSAVDVGEPVKAAEKIAAAEDLIKKSSREIRSLARLLHGEELVSRGLVAAIAFELEWLEKSDRFRIHYHSDVSALAPHADKETIVFRLFQETLNNIIRHANAYTIGITLQAADGRLTLSITDDGQGFDVAAMLRQPKGLGLRNMQKRTGMLGGEASIVSSPGNGTSITFIIPYNHPLC